MGRQHDPCSLRFEGMAMTSSRPRLHRLEFVSLRTSNRAAIAAIEGEVVLRPEVPLPPWTTRTAATATPRASPVPSAPTRRRFRLLLISPVNSSRLEGARWTRGGRTRSTGGS
jgi:hypothetical protein